MNLNDVKDIFIGGLKVKSISTNDGLIWEKKTEYVINEEFQIVQGSMLGKYALVGKRANISLSTTKNMGLSGCVVVNDLGKTIKFSRTAINTSKNDRDMIGVQFILTEEEKGNRIYTAFCYNDNGERTVNEMSFDFEVR